MLGGKHECFGQFMKLMKSDANLVMYNLFFSAFLRKYSYINQKLKRFCKPNMLSWET